MHRVADDTERQSRGFLLAVWGRLALKRIHRVTLQCGRVTTVGNDFDSRGNCTLACCKGAPPPYTRQKRPICRARRRGREGGAGSRGQRCAASSSVCFQFDTLVEGAAARCQPARVKRGAAPHLDMCSQFLLKTVTLTPLVKHWMGGRRGGVGGFPARLQMGTMWRSSQRSAPTTSQTPRCCRSDRRKQGKQTRNLTIPEPKLALQRFRPPNSELSNFACWDSSLNALKR